MAFVVSSQAHAPPTLLDVITNITNHNGNSSGSTITSNSRVGASVSSFGSAAVSVGPADSDDDGESGGGAAGGAVRVSSSSNSSSSSSSSSSISTIVSSGASKFKHSTKTTSLPFVTCDNVGLRTKRIDPRTNTFDIEDSRVKQDVVAMIIQYLQNEGYTASMLTIQDEANVKKSEHVQRRHRIQTIRRHILEGQWLEAEALCNKQTFKNYKSVLYAIYKQQYLELIDKQEYQKAFTFLNKRLKPFESLQSIPNEFNELCYLLTCKSVQDVESLRDWDGVLNSREKLVEQFENILEFDDATTSTADIPSQNRLLDMLQQAVAYQIEFSRYHPKMKPKIASLLEDYRTFVLPNVLKSTFHGHTKDVKCVEFVGEDGMSLVTGSSDNTLKVWTTESGALQGTLEGHTSRIWDASSSANGQFVASASGDATVKIWDLRRLDSSPLVSELRGHEGDIYTVKMHPGGTHVVSGGYDKSVRLYDLETNKIVKTLNGHKSSVSSTIFNPHGNLIVSGSKDSTIKFWDIVSGSCIKTFSAHLGEVTSVEMNSYGTQLLSASKDNSNRLFDITTSRLIQRFKGHLNTSKNFVRTGFGPNQKLVVGGSEDGKVYVWDMSTSNLLQKLSGHDGMVYNAKWNAHQSLLASCSHDNTVKTWWYNPDKPHFIEE